MEYINKIELREAINKGWIYENKHPSANLWIYNYTPIVQYEKIWNDITKKCRGLILDADGNIVSRTFPKFWNLGEDKPEDIPNLPFKCFEKMDGGLGIMYFLDDKPYIASRGSFNSESAIHATELLYSKYSHTFDKLDRNKTYIFEIIYSWTRVVVDYGDMDDIILLTIIDNETAEETLEDIGFPLVKQYDGVKNLEELKLYDSTNKEGFVIRFSNGFRVKVKFDEYCRLHRIVTEVSNLDIWETMMNNRSMEEILDRVPDEFYNWVRDTKDELLKNYKTIEDEAKSHCIEFENRREFAEYVKKQKKNLQGIIFSMVDGNDYSENIWKQIRPKFQKPFKITKL